MGNQKGKQAYSVCTQRHPEEGTQTLGKDTYTKSWKNKVLSLM